MVETIGRQLEDVVLGQRLFSDIQVWSNFKTSSASCKQSSSKHIFAQFALDDGVVHAHKPLLMARCDMMQVAVKQLEIFLRTLLFVQNELWSKCCSFQAMFSDSFLESSARCVRFPGVTCATFRSLLHFLYTGDILASCLWILNRHVQSYAIATSDNTVDQVDHKCQFWFFACSDTAPNLSPTAAMPVLELANR